MRLLLSLLFVACFSPSGLAAVKWEISWESIGFSTGSVTPVTPQRGNEPVIVDYSDTASMEVQASSSSVVVPSLLLNQPVFEFHLRSQALCVLEPPGKVLLIPWLSFKVPIKDS